MLSVVSFGQERGGKGKRGEQKERMKKLKIAYITEELNLTSVESEKFWPVYNEQQDIGKDCRKAIKAEMKKINGTESMSESDFLRSVEVIESLKARNGESFNNYIKESVAIIGVDRARKLMDIDRQFKEKMRGEMEKRKGMRDDLPPPPPPMDR